MAQLDVLTYTSGAYIRNYLLDCLHILHTTHLKGLDVPLGELYCDLYKVQYYDLIGCFNVRSISQEHIYTLFLILDKSTS